MDDRTIEAVKKTLAEAIPSTAGLFVGLKKLPTSRSALEIEEEALIDEAVEKRLRSVMSKFEKSLGVIESAAKAQSVMNIEKFRKSKSMDPKTIKEVETTIGISLTRQLRDEIGRLLQRRNR